MTFAFWRTSVSMCHSQPSCCSASSAKVRQWTCYGVGEQVGLVSLCRQHCGLTIPHCGLQLLLSVMSRLTSKLRACWASNLLFKVLLCSHSPWALRSPAAVSGYVLPVSSSPCLWLTCCHTC